MKLFTRPFSVHSLALASLLLLGACSKKNNDPTPSSSPSTTTSATTWTEDNKNYTATTNIVQVSTGVMALGIGQAVSATESHSMTLTVPAATGTYDLATVGTPSAYATSIGGINTAYFVLSGSVTVTTLSATEVTGTFSFSAASLNPIVTKNITNGKFAIKR